MPSEPDVQLDQRWLEYTELVAAQAQLGAPDLIARLADGRALVRANALLGLAALGHPGRELVPFLRDADPRVASAAASALAHLGTAQRGNLTEIAAALDGARPEVSTIVRRMFSELVGRADAELVGVLDTASEVSANAVVQACALVATRGLSVLQAAARDPRVRVRINAANGIALLGEVDQQSSMDVLMDVERDDPVSDVRATARAAIAKLRARTRAAVSARRKTTATVPPSVPELEQRVLTPAELRAAVPIAPLDELLRALEAPHVHARVNAVRVLGLRATPTTARALAVCLRDADATVRSEAALALGKLGAAGVDAAPELVLALADAEPAVISAVEAALAGLGGAAAPALVDGLDTPSEARGVRVAALVGQLADGAQRLRAALGSTSVDARVHAASGLAGLGTTRAGAASVPALGIAARSGNARLRAAVTKAIAALDPKPDRAAPAVAIAGFDDKLLADAELAKAKAVIAAVGVAGIVAHLRDARVAVRANAAAALGVLGAEALPVADILAVYLRDDAPEVRLAAARAIDRLGDAAVAACAPDLVRALREADDALATQLAAMLRSRAHAAVADALVRGLDTPDERHAQRLAEIVCARPSAIDELWLAFQRPPAQANAARGLAMLGKDRIGRGRALLESVGAESPPQMRERARAVVREIDGAPPPPQLPAIADFDAKILEPAAFGDPGKLDAARLFQLLHDGRPVVRANSATALGALGPDATAYATALGAVLRDEDERVRLAAARALDRLGDDAVVAAAAYLVGALRGSPALADACRGVLAARKAKVERALLAGLETPDEAHGMRIAELVAALPNGRELLFIAFDGPAQNVQMNAAYGIGMLGAKLAGDAGRRRLVAGLAGPLTPRRDAMVKALALLDAPRRPKPA